MFMLFGGESIKGHGMKSPQRLIAAIFLLLLFLFSVTPSLPPTLAQSKKKINSLTGTEKRKGGNYCLTEVPWMDGAGHTWIRCPGKDGK